MSDNFAIKVQNLTKIYKLYDSPLDRLKESINPIGKKYHTDFHALNDVCFEIAKGETVGIIGKNGSGKSTLLKLITGVLTPTSGTVTVNGKVSALLELGAGFNPELTGIENVYFNGTIMGYTREEMDDRLDAILTFADIGEFVQQPVKTYSSGMFVRLAFAVAVNADPDILVVDEALSVGDVFFQQKCHKRLTEMKGNGATILFVTHAMGEVIQLCQRAFLLHANRLEFTGVSAEAVKRYLLLQQRDQLSSYIGTVADAPKDNLRTAEDAKVERFWPQPQNFIDLSDVDEVTCGIARCTGVALCKSDGNVSSTFMLGDSISIFFEFEIDHQIEVPIGGFVIKNSYNTMVHGKSSLHYDDLDLPTFVKPLNRIRFRSDFVLDIEQGEYTFDVGLSMMRRIDYVERCYELPAHTQAKTVRLCHLSNVGRFSVVQKPVLGKGYDSLHSGICNLKGTAEVYITDETVQRKDHMPTIFHVTHWKAGSQWIKRILREVSPECYIDSQLGVAHFLKEPIREGGVYPTVYVTKEQFESVHLPPVWHRFVVIRDLRDTLISGYFSLKVSHSVISSQVNDFRTMLNNLNLEDGLIYLSDNWLHLSADIQKSWLSAGEEVIRYEDLLGNDVGILTRVLIDKCSLPVSRETLQNVIENNRFEKLTNGRKSGTEDVSAHERKGIAGDWRNYFTRNVTEHFKILYGDLLIQAGYEKDTNW